MTDLPDREMDRGNFLFKTGAAALGIATAGVVADAGRASIFVTQRASREGALVAYKGPLAQTIYPTACENLPALIALEKGFFKRQKLDLEVVSFTTGSAIARAMQQGQIPFGVCAVLTILSAFGQGFTELRAVGAASLPQSIGFAVRTDSGINSAAQVKGKKVAIVGGTTAVTYYLLTQMLKSAGLTPSDVSVVSLGGIPDCMTALLNDVVDVALFIKPVVSQHVVDGKVKILYDAGRALPKLTASGEWSTATFVGGKPNVVKQYVTATAQAQQWIRHNRKAAAALWAKKLNMNPNVILNTLTPSFVAGYQITLPVAGFYANRAAGVSLGTVPPTLSYYSFVVDRWAKEAARKYGK